MPLLRAAISLANTASSSSSVLCIRSAAALHTSATRFAESQKQRVARIVRKTNIEKKAERAHHHEENKPHIVLGTHPGQEETKWRKCDLAKILVTPEKLDSLRPVDTITDGVVEVEVPKYIGYGLDGLDSSDSQLAPKDYFFKMLPDASFVAEIENNKHISEEWDAKKAGALKSLSPEERRITYDTITKEGNKAQQLARVVDLRNASARGIAFENRRRIIAAFSPTGKTADSGYPEVQVALLTMKIRNVWNHLMQRKKDLTSRRALRLLVHQRAKMLKYIKRVDRDRYDRVLERVGLEPESVEGELVV